MNRDVLKGQWMQLKGRVKEAWGDLTDDDLTRVAGDWDQLVGRIQERTGEAREAIELELDRMLTRFRQAPPAMEDAS
jgi:uncharacterized protein YjbJ (UPF0337 family)